MGTVVTDNEWAARGREAKALAIEHALTGAGISTYDDLARFVLPDQRIRYVAERAAADTLGHTWRKPASDCNADGRGHEHPEGRCCTWGRVAHLFRTTDQSRAMIRATTTED